MPGGTRVRNRYILWAGALGAALLALSLVRGGSSNLTAAAGRYGMAAMLSELQAANAEIGSVNASILAALSTVKRQADGVERVHERMRSLERLLGAQSAELDRLGAGTARQAELSRKLEELTAEAGASTAGLARTASLEAELVESMSRRTADMAGVLGDIGAHNRAAAEKLGRAEELSAVILSRMP